VTACRRPPSDYIPAASSHHRVDIHGVPCRIQAQRAMASLTEFPNTQASTRSPSLPLQHDDIAVPMPGGGADDGSFAARSELNPSSAKCPTSL